jgi:hypothetical protein
MQTPIEGALSPKAKPMKRKKNKNGRPTLLTPELSKKICSYILAGSYEHAAAQACGISRHTFMEWMRRGEGRPGERPKTTKYANFANGVRHAAANARVAAEVQVKTTDPKWWLHRKYPEDWAATQDGEQRFNVDVGVGVRISIETARALLADLERREINVTPPSATPRPADRGAHALESNDVVDFETARRVLDENGPSEEGDG